MRGLRYASLALAISSIGAHPHFQHSKSLSKRTVDLNAFRLNIASDYTNSTSVGTNSTLVGTNSTLVGTNSTVSSSFTKRATPEDTATSLVKKAVPAATIRLVESYTGTNSMAHFYYKQTANDIDIDNADFNVNVS
jgi:extracellular elastinolytic metalloproteinase